MPDISDAERARREAYYRANRERILARAKEWRAAHPERYREVQRKHYLATKDERQAQRRALKAQRELERVARRKASATRFAERIVDSGRKAREQTRIARSHLSPDKREGFVYVLTHPRHTGFVKIGKTRDVTARLCAYNAGCPDRTYRIDAIVRVGDATTIEERAHELLTPHHHAGEWFRCDVATAAAAIKNAATPSVFD